MGLLGIITEVIVIGHVTLLPCEGEVVVDDATCDVVFTDDDMFELITSHVDDWDELSIEQMLTITKQYCS